VRTRRWSGAVTALGLLTATLIAGPAAVSRASATQSPSPQAQLNQIQARLAEDRVQLNLAQASDNAVLTEVTRLQNQVALEQSTVAADQSALQAADAQVAAATQRLDDLRSQGQAAHAALVARAVDLYEHPFEQTEILLDGTASLDDLTTRQVLAESVQASTNDLIDAVRAQQIQVDAASSDLRASQVLAATRHTEAVAEYGALETALASEQQAHAALQARISDGDSQVSQLTGQEASLEAQLNGVSAQYAAQIAAAAASQPALGPVGSFGLQWPIHGVVTQEFGHNGHPGIDIAAAWGTPIHASGTGVVIYASWESGYGNYTCINHGNSISTCYGHQSAIYVSVGQTVTRGQVIGAEGSTGHSTGPHVHFEVRVNGVVHNPRNFIPGNP
jgi:murein DD-endopeptidase MepM/ murein hydrolase activator NlpD